MIKVHSFVLHECNHHHHLHCYCRSPLDLFQCETNEREMVQYRPNSKTKKHCRSIFPSSKSTNAMNISTFHIENDHGDHEKHKYAENFQHFVGLIDFSSKQINGIIIYKKKKSFPSFSLIHSQNKRLFTEHKFTCRSKNNSDFIDMRRTHFISTSDFSSSTNKNALFSYLNLLVNI